MDGRPARVDGSSLGPATALLASGALASAGTAALILTRHRLPAGAVALVGAVAIAVAGKASWARPGARERFGARLLDRVYEASILVPLAWVNREGANIDSVLALVGLGASYLAAYQRAKGRALGYQSMGGAAFLWTRYAILVLVLLTGWLLAGLWVFVVLTVLAAVVQAWNVARQERTATAPADRVSR
jgi:phosphatidylglycerophosphate synthase